MDNIRKSFIILSVLTILYGIYYWGIPSVIKIGTRMPKIEKKLEDKTGIKFSVQNPKIKMGLIPGIWFMAENVAILNDDGTKAVNLEHSAIKIYLLPLILGKIHIGNFSSDKIDINLIYTQNSELKLGQYSLKNLPKVKLTLTKAFFRIGDYKIKLDDLKQNKKILLDGNYFILDEFRNNKKIKFSTFAKFYVNQKSSDIMADIDIKLPINKVREDQFKVNGRISHLDLADFSPYLNALPSSKIKSINGIVDLIADTSNTEDKHKNIFAQLKLENLSIIQDDPTRSIKCDDQLVLKTDIKTIKNGLSINNMEIKSKGINSIVKGEITNLDAKIPYTNLNIDIKNSRTEKFISILPAEENLIEEVNFYALKNNIFYGDINGTINVKGKADVADVNGKITVTEGYLNSPIKNNTPKATIKLIFNGDKMNMDVEVPASKNQTVFVNGNVELYNNKNSDLYIKSTSEVDLKTAQTVLNPLHEILKFDIGPVPIMDIRGLGNINLHVTGNRKNPHAWGEFNFKNTTASFLDIHNMVLTNGAGKLIFDDQKTSFKTTSAILNNKPINIVGTCTLLGVLDFDVETKNQELQNLLKIVQTSPMLEDIQNLLSPISAASGPVDFTVKLTGTITDVNDVVFNKNIFAKGKIKLISNSVTSKGYTIPGISGVINFNNLNTDLDLKSNLSNSIVEIRGKMNNKNANINIYSNKFILKDGFDILKLNLPYKEDLGKIHTSFHSNYNGDIEKINLNGITLNGKIYNSKSKNFSINDTSFIIKNSNLILSTLQGKVKESPYKVNINISKILSDKQTINGNFEINNFNLKNLNDFKKYIKPNSQVFSNFEGLINLKGYIRNNAVYAETNLNNIKFDYTPANLKINILSSGILIRDDILIINKMNSKLGEMPVFVNGRIYNIYSKPNLSLYINAKPTQEFIDEIFNVRALYPLKIKGDINFASTLSGRLQSLRNKTQLKLSENASIYYMGATLGNSGENNFSNAVNITIDNIIYANGIKINNLQYDRLIPSQNNKLYTKTQLKASGALGFLPNNDIKFTNFKVKTLQPTDAKIFNIIFRKPIMKQGIFTSDITINGKASAPLITGKFDITSIDMPLFDATIKDMSFDFKPDRVYLNSKGVVLNNNLNISAIMQNRPNPPLIFEDIKIKLEDLDLNRITNALRDYEADSPRKSAINDFEIPDIKNIIIKKSSVSANNIKIKNLVATNFESNATLNNKMQFEVPNFQFKVAEGFVEGSFGCNLNSHDINFKMNIKDTNAQIIAETLFDLKGQIYGLLTGDINLICKGLTQDACTASLSGSGHFNVKNGRMPKLGSLEYLLKAGNLVKGGITGLSINGIIDLITPYKTGDFDSISGNININNGIADNIEIYSAGRDLNMYLKGSYNLKNLIADMQIFGALTKNFSTLFGKIGNASLNTLFNTIPGINVSEAPTVITEDIKKIPNVEKNSARMFAVEIYGDINGDDYVRSFRWIK